VLYGDLTTALALLAQYNDAFGTYTFIQSPDFSTYLPRIIEYAEDRIYREVVPLATRQSNATATFQAGLRTLPLIGFKPQPVVVEGLAAITPVNTPPQKGTRWQYRMASLDLIDSVWPIESTTMAPSAAWPELYWALVDNQTIVVAPTPDQAYTVEATGIFRPTPMSAQNPETYLGDFYPDLLLAACMIAVAGLQRDYGQQADDPKLAMSWESQYQLLKASAMEEEQRRRGQGQGFSTQPPAPEAHARRAASSGA